MALDRDRYASDVRQSNEAHEQRLERRRRERAHHHEPSRRRHGGFSPLAAAAVAGGAMALSALLGRRYSPDRSHPGIERWYRELEKPSFTPPDPVFGAVWPALEVSLAAGGYRLLREPSSPDRDRALALWAVNVAMIPGWTKIFFGERSPAGGLAAAIAQLGAGLAYVETARRVDGVAAACGAPYAAWLAFANVLAEEVWRRNAGER
jgi:tryptophan-rich sensory protein